MSEFNFVVVIFYLKDVYLVGIVEDCGAILCLLVLLVIVVEIACFNLCSPWLFV